jgi:hypothetical protein
MELLLIIAISIGCLLALVAFVIFMSFVVIMINNDKENLELDFDFDN